MPKYTIGVDIGGTNIKLGLVNSSGKIISQNRFETKSFASSKTKLIDALINAIQKLISKNKLTLKNTIFKTLKISRLFSRPKPNP